MAATVFGSGISGISQGKMIALSVKNMYNIIGLLCSELIFTIDIRKER